MIAKGGLNAGWLFLKRRGNRFTGKNVCSISLKVLFLFIGSIVSLRWKYCFTGKKILFQLGGTTMEQIRLCFSLH